MYKIRFNYRNEMYDITAMSFNFSEKQNGWLAIKIEDNLFICFDVEEIKDFNYEIIKPLA